MLAATKIEKTPLTKQLDALTLWIAAAAGFTMVVMFALGRSRSTNVGPRENSALRVTGSLASRKPAPPAGSGTTDELSPRIVKAANRKLLHTDIGSSFEIGYTRLQLDPHPGINDAHDKQLKALNLDIEPLRDRAGRPGKGLGVTWQSTAH